MSESQARQLMKDAEKKLGGGSMIKSFFFGGNVQEEAIEIYNNAANLFKMNKLWKEAAEAFMKTVEIHSKMDQKHDAATAYISASNAYKQAGMNNESVKCLEEAATIYTLSGKFSQAAKILKDAGETYEKEENFEKAAECLKKAADYYEGENAKSSSTGCLVKVAHMYAQLKKYDEAISIWEKCVSQSLDDRLMTWGSKEYLFKALLCRLAKIKDAASELEGVKNSVFDYKELDVRFPDTRECKLVEKIIDAFDAQDLKGFRAALKDFDSVTKLTPFLTSLLTEIKIVLEKSITEVDVK
jgi:alpha-soluble NSF attachment protein